jgi:hypothetical protein
MRGRGPPFIGGEEGCIPWNIVFLFHQERRETTSIEEFHVTCSKWLGMHIAAQILVGDDMGFHSLNLRRFVPEPWL